MGEVGKEETRNSHREDLLVLDVEYWHVLHGRASGSLMVIDKWLGDVSVAGKRFERI